MRTSLVQHRTVMWILLAVSGGIGLRTVPADAQVWDDPVFGGSTSQPAEEPDTDDQADSGELTERQKEAIEKLTVYYLEMFDKHLASRDWMTRAMAVLSLNRLPDKRVTDRLFTRLKADPAPLVKIFAWEPSTPATTC